MSQTYFTIFSSNYENSIKSSIIKIILSSANFPHSPKNSEYVLNLKYNSFNPNHFTLTSTKIILRANVPLKRI